MLDPRIRLKTPWLAAVLTFLVPGAGQLYQGRLFKAAIYFFCILGLYFTGMRMAGWQAVYIHRPPAGERIRGKHHTLQFVAQAGVGLPAICALIQNKRYYSPQNESTRNLDEPLSAHFEGEVHLDTDDDPGNVSGTIELRPAEGRFGRTVAGRFTGTLESGEPVEFQLGEHVSLDAPVKAGRGRELVASIVEGEGDNPRIIGTLDGSIPRPLHNWFVVPVDTLQERQLHHDLGKFHELAMVFTWVAGLLNILAIWDALEGPAYGYGDEEPAEPAEPDKQKSAASQEPAAPPRKPATATA
jgi:hypothetical protein